MKWESDNIKDGEEYLYHLSDELSELQKEYVNDNTDLALIIRELIEVLDNYLLYGDGRNFPKYYGISEEDYLFDKKRQDRKKGQGRESVLDVVDFIGIRDKMKKNTWNAKAKQSEYFARCDSVNFANKVISILSKIDAIENHSFKVPNYLEQLAKKRSGISKIDAENKKIYSLYRQCLGDDKTDLKTKMNKEVEESINYLRIDSAIYKMRSHPSDKRTIGNNGMTFAELFRKIRNLAAKKMSVEFDYDSKEELNDISKQNYLVKIEELGKLLNDLETSYNKRQEMVHNSDEYTFTIPEQEEMQRINGINLGIIHDIKNNYETIQKNKEKYIKVLKSIDALNERKMAIEKTIDFLISENNRNPYNVGNVSVFKSTLNMLYNEQRKVDEQLKKYQDIVKLFDKLFNDISEKKMQIDNLSAPINKITGNGKQRKTLEKDEQKKAMYEKEREQQMLLEAEVLRVVEEIKPKIENQMKDEGWEPRLRNFDGERYDEDYSEYKKELNKRIDQALIEMGYKDMLKEEIISPKKWWHNDTLFVGTLNVISVT